jgi:hypothetical protein
LPRIARLGNFDGRGNQINYLRSSEKIGAAECCRILLEDSATLAAGARPLLGAQNAAGAALRL